MHFKEDAEALLELMRKKLSDRDCYMLGYDDDDGASGYFELQHKLRQALEEYIKAYEN